MINKGGHGLRRRVLSGLVFPRVTGDSRLYGVPRCLRAKPSKRSRRGSAEGGTSYLMRRGPSGAGGDGMVDWGAGRGTVLVLQMTKVASKTPYSRPSHVEQEYDIAEVPRLRRRRQGGES